MLAAPRSDALREPARQAAPAGLRCYQYVEQPEMVAVHHAQREGDGPAVLLDLGEAHWGRDRAQQTRHRLPMQRRHRAQRREACQPVLGRGGCDAYLRIGRKAAIEGRPLDQAFIDPAIAGLRQEGVGPGRGERGQAPDRRQVALPIGGFQRHPQVARQRAMGI